jgi:biopolymer transport protein TolQ
MNPEFVATSANPIHIFMNADIVVQSVITFLIFASVCSWSIIIARVMKIGKERRQIRAVAKRVASVSMLGDLEELAQAGEGRVHKILKALAREWKWSADHAGRDYHDIRQRLASQAEIAIDRHYADLASTTNWLATIGNTAPFLGLFGTVWGIMNSFIAIGQAQDTSLAVVAPGMAEALFATAVGLFCAIPASIGYNCIVDSLGRTSQEWRRIAGRVEVRISRSYGIVRRVPGVGKGWDLSVVRTFGTGRGVN